MLSLFSPPQGIGYYYDHFGSQAKWYNNYYCSIYYSCRIQEGYDEDFNYIPAQSFSFDSLYYDDGSQHFMPSDLFGGKKELLNRKGRDEFKNSYAVS